MLKVWDAKNVVSNHSHGVRWGDEEAMFTKDHVLVLESRTRFLSLSLCLLKLHFYITYILVMFEKQTNKQVKSRNNNSVSPPHRHQMLHQNHTVRLACCQPDL